MGQKRGDFRRVLSAGQVPCSLEVADSSRFGMWIFWSGQKLPQVLAVPRLPVQSASVYLRPLDHWPATPVSFSVLPPQTAAPKRSWGGRNVVLSFLFFFASLFLYELLHAVFSCFVFQFFFYSLNFPLFYSWGDFLNCSLSPYWVLLSHSFGSLQQIGVCAVFCPLYIFFLKHRSGLTQRPCISSYISEGHVSNVRTFGHL